MKTFLKCAIVIEENGSLSGLKIVNLLIFDLSIFN